MAEFVKDPGAFLDFSIEWAAWLASGETISASSWTVPAGVTEVSSTNGTTSTTIWLSGGTDQQNYSLINRITTSAGRIDERRITVRVRER